MSSTPIGRPAPAPSFVPRPQLDRAGRAAIVLLCLLGAMAMAGGVSLVSAPDGSVMKLPTSLLAGSPFPDFFVPGLILGGLFGVGSLVVALMGLARLRIAPFLAFAIGIGQMIWIVVELSVIKEVSFFHPLCFAMGFALAASSVRWGWPTFSGWQAARG